MSEKISPEKRRLVHELHAPARRNFPRRRVIVWRYDDLWSLHAIQQKLPLHSVIDMLSKYAWAVLLKSRSGNDVAAVIAKIICDDERCPKNLQTDRRMEFYNANMISITRNMVSITIRRIP